MLRVVLADDENKIILLLQKLIDWESLGYEIAGTAMTDSKLYLKHFQTVFADRLSDSEQKTLTLFTAPNNLPRQIRKLFYPKRLRARLAGEVAIRILFLIGKI